MKKSALVLMGFIILISWNISHAQAEGTKIKVKLLDKMNLSEKLQIKASLAELTPSATQEGLDDGILYGSYTTKKLLNSFYRVSIAWHTLGSNNNQLNEKVALKPNFVSSFKTNEVIIATGTLLTAVGDVDLLVKTYGKVKTASTPDGQITAQDQQTAKTKLKSTPIAAVATTAPTSNAGVPSGTGAASPAPAPTAGVTTKNIVACQNLVNIPALQVFQQQRTERVASDGTVLDSGTCAIIGQPFPILKTYGCQQSGALFEAYTLDATVNGIAVPIQACTEDPTRPISTTTQAMCNDRFNEPTLELFKQEKTVTRDGAGSITSQTACVDVGLPIPVTKDYTVCVPLPNYTTNVVNNQYQYIATVGGVASIVQACTPDLTVSYPIIESATGCTVRDDLILNKSYQQVALTYTDVTQTVKQLRGCQDSANPALTYTHFNTSQTCTAGIDPVTNTAILYERSAYFDSTGLIKFATVCAPTQSTVREEYCQTTTDDFAAGISYMNTRKYFLDSRGFRVNLDNNACTKTNLQAGIFPHVKTLCNYNHYDAQKISKPVRSISIDTTTDPLSTLGSVTLQVCTEENTPIGHVPVVGSAAWAVSSSVGIPLFSVTIANKATFYTGPATAAQLDAKFAATWSFPDGTPFNLNGWSKEYTTCSTTPGRFFICAQGTCFEQITTCSGNKNTYIKNTTYTRPDNTTYLFGDPLSVQRNVCGGATKPPL